MIQAFFSQTLQILITHSRWMGWNTFLAIVPFVLSLMLFRQLRFGRSMKALPPAGGYQIRHRSVLWWIGVGVFVAFLPNAPYVLTDIIHLPQSMAIARSPLVVLFTVIPLYVLFMGVGFEAYVLSLMNMGYYLKRRGLERWIVPMEMTLHVLSAIGVYLGRVVRFNSWDLVTRLDEVIASVMEDLLGRRPIFSMVIFTGITIGLYHLFKMLTLALFESWRVRRDLFEISAQQIDFRRTR